MNLLRLIEIQMENHPYLLKEESYLHFQGRKKDRDTNSETKWLDVCIQGTGCIVVLLQLSLVAILCLLRCVE